MTKGKLPPCPCGHRTGQVLLFFVYLSAVSLMPGLSLLRVVLTCVSLAWGSTPLANPVDTVASAGTFHEKLVMPARAWQQPSGLRRIMASGDHGLRGHTSTHQSADADRLLQSIRMLGAGEQAFSAVAVNLPVNFLIGETEVRVGVGWIGAQNNKPAGDIAQGSAPQFAEQRFVKSTRNSVVFLFTIPF